MTWIILFAFLAVAAFFMLTEHRAHVFGLVPYLLLLACPLLHFFLHRGHRADGHGGRGRHEPGPRGPETSGR